MNTSNDQKSKSPVTAEETSAIAMAGARLSTRPARLSVSVQPGKKGRADQISCPHSDPAGWGKHLQDVFATKGFAFPAAQLNRLIQASRDKQGNVDVTRLNSMLALVEGAAPQSEVQAALAVQMALAHHASQILLERSLAADQIPQFECASNAAIKLMRTFALQVETLAKLQRGGEQIVKVVHVHAGAQAIVGNVTHSTARGGAIHENRNQPLAPDQIDETGYISAQCGTSLLREDTERKSLPVTSG